MTSSPLTRVLHLCLVVFGFSFVTVTSGRADINPVPVVTVSAASYERNAVTRGGIVSAFGSKLATATVSATDIDPNQPGIQLPERLAGTTVHVNSVPAKLLFVSAGQINFIMPDMPHGLISTLEVIAGDGSVSRGDLVVQATAPAIFTANANGAGVPVGNLVRIRNGVRLPNEPLAQFDPVTKTFVARPIAFGPEMDRVFLELYCTGVRGASDTNNDGNRKESVWVLLGGQALTPAYAGPQADFAGLDQVNIELPRTLKGAGKVHLSLHGQFQWKVDRDVSFWGLTSRLVECELGGDAPTGTVQIADFSPATILAGQQLTLNGAGFALNPADNRVTIGGLLAPVEMASATRLVVRVPFGAETAPVRVQTLTGEAVSATPVKLRTALSGYVEVAGDFGVSGYPLAQVQIRVPGTAYTTFTNAEGVFQLPDVPAGKLIVEADATALLGANVPPVRFPVQTVAGKDNLLTEPIWFSLGNRVNFEVNDDSIGWTLLTDVGGLSLAKKTSLQLADGRVTTLVGITRLIVPPSVPAFRQVLPDHENTRIFRITPFDATFAPAAKLIVPVYGSAENYQVFRYDQRLGSPTFGQLLPVEGLSNEPGGLGIPVTETGDYVVQHSSIIYLQGYTTYNTGSLLLPDGKTPLQNAFVTTPFSLLGSMTTDSAGSFDFFGSSEPLLVRSLRPNGEVLRKVATESDYEHLSTLLRFLPRTATGTFSSGLELLGVPTQLLGTTNESYEWNFLAATTAQTIQSVSVSGAPFASILSLGNGIYRLRLQPGNTDWGTYTIEVSATTSAGEIRTRSTNVRLVAPNVAPVITAPLTQVIKPGEAFSFDITITDADANQQVKARIEPVGSFAFPAGLEVTQTPTTNGVRVHVNWVPKPHQIGTFGFSVVATDNGYGNLATSKTITLGVATIPPLNVWTHISESLRPSYGMVPRHLLVQEEVVYFGLPVFRSTNNGLTWSLLNAFGGVGGGMGATRQHVFVSVFGTGIYRYDLATEASELMNTGLRVLPQEGVSPVLVSGDVLLVEVGNSNGRRVYYSTNAGAKWTFLHEGSGEQDLLVSDGNGNIFVRGTGNRIFKATWNGTALALLPTDLTTVIPHLVTSQGNRMYAAVATANPVQDQVLVSTDAGLHWQTTNFPVGKYQALHAVGNRLYAQTEKGTLVSLDEGKNWNPYALPAGTEALRFASNRQYLYLLTIDGRLYLSPLP